MLVKPKDMNDFHRAQERDMKFFNANRELYDTLIKEREILGNKLFTKYTKGVCREKPKNTKEELEVSVKQKAETLARFREMGAPEDLLKIQQTALEEEKIKLDNGEYILTESEQEYRKLYDKKKQEFYKKLFDLPEWKEFEKKVAKAVDAELSNK